MRINESRPLVTIITATLNSAKTLQATLDSVKRQDYGNIEHIIVDGVSTDGTLTIVRDYVSESNRRRRVIVEADDGMYEAINRGLKLASGSIVGLLNSDDRYCDNAISEVVNEFAANGADLVFGNIVVKTVGAQGRPTVTEWVANIGELSHCMSIPHPAVFVKCEVYKRFGAFDTQYKIAADYELMLRFRKQGVVMVHLKSTLADFSAGGKSGTRLWRTAYETFRIQGKYVGWLRAGTHYGHRLIELTLLRWAVILLPRKRKPQIPGGRT